MIERQIEEVALRAWPALEEIAVIEPSLACYLPLERSDSRTVAPCDFYEESPETWLKVHALLTNRTQGEMQAHWAILREVKGRRIHAVVADDDEPIACGLGVLEGEYFGLFDVVVRPDRRNRRTVHPLVRDCCG